MSSEKMNTSTEEHKKLWLEYHPIMRILIMIGISLTISVLTLNLWIYYHYTNNSLLTIDLFHIALWICVITIAIPFLYALLTGGAK